MKYSDISIYGKEIEIPNLLGGNSTVKGRKQNIYPMYRMVDGKLKEIKSLAEHERLLKEPK